MRILHYCQHVLGLGHFMRSLAVTRALAGHEVLFVSGGRRVPVPLPGHARLLSLPALEMSEDFSEFGPADLLELEETKTRRVELLLEAARTFGPQVIIIELFPFGRKKFGFELSPLLHAARSGCFGPCAAVCSLRDILVERGDAAKFEARAVNLLNAYFSALLVHADPRLFRLEDSFSRAADLTVPVVYTGYVAERPAPGAGAALRAELGLAPGERLIIASAGGGKVGGELLRAAVLAQARLPQSLRARLQVFTGPYMAEEDVDELRDLAAGRPEVAIERFTERFPAWLAAADCSVSMAGYNTTMDILASGVPALVRPFDVNREQADRAARLAEMGLLTVLKDLEPEYLACAMETALAKGRRPGPPPIDLDGAATTARYISERFGEMW